MRVGIDIRGKVAYFVDNRIKVLPFPKDEISSFFAKIKDEFSPDEVAVSYPSSEDKELLEKQRDMFASFFLISEPLSCVISSGFDDREKPIFVFGIDERETVVSAAKIASDSQGRPNLTFLNTEPILNTGNINIDHAVLGHIMDGNRFLREEFPQSSKEQRNLLLEKIRMARNECQTKEWTAINWKNFLFTINRDELSNIIFPFVNLYKEKIKSFLDEASIIPEDIFLVITNLEIREIKDMLFSLFPKYSFGEPAKGALLYLGIDYRVIKPKEAKEKEGVLEDIGFFYDRFVPLIYKDDLFGSDGVIKRETTVLFNRPNGQIPLIKKVGDVYQLLGVFSFFLPVEGNYSIDISLELSSKIKIIAKHPACSIVYPDIPRDGPSFKTEDRLLKEINAQIFKHAGIYGSIDIDGVIKEGEDTMNLLSRYARIPRIKDTSFRLANSLDQLKIGSKYSKKLITKDIETKAVRVLNNIAEGLFLLLANNFISFSDYRMMIEELHRSYEL
ncbi:TPA: hypothetical protein DCX16_06590 [bacterium]|nr:hypothetical protein [bacterium]